MAGYLHTSTLLMGVLNGIGVKTGKPIEKGTLYTYMSVVTPFYFIRSLGNLKEYEHKYDTSIKLPLGVRSSIGVVASVAVVGLQICMGIQIGKAFSQTLE